MNQQPSLPAIITTAVARRTPTATQNFILQSYFVSNGTTAPPDVYSASAQVKFHGGYYTKSLVVMIAFQCSFFTRPLRSQLMAAGNFVSPKRASYIAITGPNDPEPNGTCNQSQ